LRDMLITGGGRRGPGLLLLPSVGMAKNPPQPGDGSDGPVSSEPLDVKTAPLTSPGLFASEALYERAPSCASDLESSSF
jgi:hypothetical protein